MFMAKLQSAILCPCGEHYVASYLSGMGLVVALTRAGSPATDLIVTSVTGGRSVSLQVKAGGLYSYSVYKRKPENNQWTWRVGKKAMDRAKDLYWFAFVYIGDWPQRQDSPAPRVFFVPSKIVAKKLRSNDKSQQDWFWMLEDEAEPYCGMAGYKKLKKAINGKS
jgi:hypothetical protein